MNWTVLSEDELDRALATQADAIGVNARNLHTFNTSLEIVKSLIRQIPRGRTPVAESALRTREEVVALQETGAIGFLMGEVLMRASQPGEKLRELLNG